MENKVLLESLRIDDFIDELLGVDPSYANDITTIEAKYNCEISIDTEKHNALQYTYFYDVDFGIEENLFIEIESGINNGTQLNNNEWGSSSKQLTKTVEVLTDVILDYDFYKENSFAAKKAQAVLDRNKNKFFDFHRQNSYDNYVTGGNSKMSLNPLLSQLHITYLYKQKEVDCNFL